MPQAGRILWQVRCVWVLRAHPSAPREAVPGPSPRGRAKPLAPTAPHCRGFVSSSLVLAPVVLGFVLPVAFCRQSREPGKGSCCLLGHTVGFIHIAYPAFMVLLLLFPRVSLCSLFCLPCWVCSTTRGCSTLGRLDSPAEVFGVFCIWGKYSKPRRGSSNFEIQIFS